MPAFHKLQLSFNAGELSPFLAGRTDVQKYESGCKLLENYIILPYGGVIRRPGTQYMGPAQRNDLPCRLIGFNFSVTTNFILEFGHAYVRFWTNGQQVMNPGAPTVPLEYATPYNYAHLRELQYTQINDIMYIVHPSYTPYKLQRLADNSWSMAPVAFKWPPLQDENITGCNITPSGTSGAISLTSNCGIFTANDVGSTWQIGHAMAGASQTWTEVALGATTANSAAIRVRGPWSLITYGTWSGEVRVIRTIYRTGITETIRTYHNTVDGQRNVSTTGTEDDDCSLYIAFITGGTAGSSNPIARLEFSNAKVYGLVNITGVASSTVAYANVAWGMASTAATVYWSRPAFSAQYGYPRTVCLHDQRLIYGGTWSKPLSVHGSQIDDYDNFQRGVAADDGFMFNISANESNPIQWMVSQTKLLIGTAGDEWAMGGQKEDEALGAGNVQAVQQSSFGSSYMQARVVNEVILFAQRQGRKIRELTYSFEKDGWVAPDLTILANHICGSGFVETAFAQQPDAIFWAITSDGRLVGMTYERDQNVVGWHRHSTEGTFESVGTIYGGSNADEVWFSVTRTINGVTKRYIERFDPNFRKTFEAMDKSRYWYLDCGYRSSGGPTGLATIAFNAVGEGAWANLYHPTDPKPFTTGTAFTISTGELFDGYIVVAGITYDEHGGKLSTVWFDGEQVPKVDWRMDASTHSWQGFLGLAVGHKPAGTHRVTIITEGGVPLEYGYFNAFAYSGVNQTSPTGVATFVDHNTSPNNTATCNVVSAVGDLVIGVTWASNNTVVGAGQTLRWSIPSEGVYYSDEPGAATTTVHSYTWTGGTSTWLLTGMTLKQAPVIPELSTVTGLSHLEGCTVGILGDGANQPTRVVTSGAITLQEPSALVLVGLPYTSIVRPMDINIPVADTMQGRTVRIHKMVLRLYKSLSCKFSSDEGAQWDEVYFRDRTDLMDSSPKMFTGDKEVSTGAGFSTAQAISLMQDRPFPLCVLAEILWINYYGI